MSIKQEIDVLRCDGSLFYISLQSLEPRKGYLLNNGEVIRYSDSLFWLLAEFFFHLNFKQGDHMSHLAPLANSLKIDFAGTSVTMGHRITMQTMYFSPRRDNPGLFLLKMNRSIYPKLHRRLSMLFPRYMTSYTNHAKIIPGVWLWGFKLINN